MKMIKVDDMIEYCENDIPPLRAVSQSVAVAALRRVIAVAKEYAVDAETVKHGKWEETHISLCKWIPEDEKEEGHSFYMAELKCSCCKRYNAVTFALTLNKPDFCQLCGARMDGDSND